MTRSDTSAYLGRLLVALDTPGLSDRDARTLARAAVAGLIFRLNHEPPAPRPLACLLPTVLRRIGERGEKS